MFQLEFFYKFKVMTVIVIHRIIVVVNIYNAYGHTPPIGVMRGKGDLHDAKASRKYVRANS